jgi:FixJ family two-component response regulator
MGKNKTIAIVGIVDDDQSVRDSISSLLRSAGFKTSLFASAEEFLNSDHLSEPDCLLLDVRMPGLSGLELQSQLRSMKYPAPIIFITALMDDQVRDKALEQGAAAFLGKPFSEEVLLGAIQSAIEVTRASAK